MQVDFDQLVMGVDPGLNSTGWSIIALQGSKLTHIASGVLDINTKLGLSDKLLLIHQQLNQYIAQYAPKVFAIEEVYVNNNAVSSLKLGQARGVAIFTAASNKLPVYEYAPRFVKKAIVGNGSADKVQVMAMINHLLRHKISNHNEADAIAIAICHLNCNKFYQATNGSK